MFIDKYQKRANYNVICNLPDAQGTKWPHPLTPAQLAELGYVEIPDPVPPTPPEGFTVEEAFFYNELTDAPYAQWTLKSPEQLKSITSSKAQNQINALELQQLLPRVTREYLMSLFIKTAADAGITPQQLLDPTPGNTHYAPGFAKVVAFDNQIKALRSQL